MLWGSVSWPEPCSAPVATKGKGLQSTSGYSSTPRALLPNLPPPRIGKQREERGGEKKGCDSHSSLAVKIPAGFTSHWEGFVHPAPAHLGGNGRVKSTAVDASPAPGLAGAQRGTAGSWQMHLQVLLGDRALNLGACRISWCLRSCQIPGDQQVSYPQPPEVTSNPAPSSRDQNIHLGWQSWGHLWVLGTLRGLRRCWHHPPVPSISLTSCHQPAEVAHPPGCVVGQQLCLLPTFLTHLGVSLGFVR